MRAASKFTELCFAVLLFQENFQEYNECLAVVNEGGDHWILLVSKF
jgi:hypothetical protein